ECMCFIFLTGGFLPPDGTCPKTKTPRIRSRKKEKNFNRLLCSSAIKIKGMAVNFYAENLFYRSFNGLYARITKLYYFAGIRKNDVVVLFVEIGFFIMCLLISELMFAHQFGIEQKFDGVIKRCTAHTVFF